MTAWLAFVLGGLATYGMRASFILFAGDRTLPPLVERSLRYVGPAVFAAMVLPLVLGDEGVERLGRVDARLLALGLGAAVMLSTRSMVVMLAGGMVALWSLQAIGL